jgi:hypothetical protein
LNIDELSRSGDVHIADPGKFGGLETAAPWVATILP